MHAPGREGVEINGHGGNKRLPFPRRHLRDLPLVEHDPADDLDVERNHIPDDRMAHEIESRPHQPPACILHHGERLREKLLQGFGSELVPFFHRIRHVVQEPLARGRVDVLLQLRPQAGQFLLHILERFLNSPPEFRRFCTKLFVGQPLVLFTVSVDHINERSEGLDILLVFASEQFL